MLIAHTPEPERVVGAAAKLCYSNAHLDDLLEGLTPEKSREFLSKLASLGPVSYTHLDVYKRQQRNVRGYGPAPYAAL